MIMIALQLNLLGVVMKRFTDSIRNALSNKDWYGALSTALTLPDVCGETGITRI